MSPVLKFILLLGLIAIAAFLFTTGAEDSETAAEQYINLIAYQDGPEPYSSIVGAERLVVCAKEPGICQAINNQLPEAQSCSSGSDNPRVLVQGINYPWDSTMVSSSCPGYQKLADLAREAGAEG